MLTRYFFSILLVLASFNVLGQRSVTDSVDVQKTSLALSFLYGSNADYFGQTTTERLPYVSATASARSRGGLFLSASTYKLLNVSESSSGIDLTGGYAFKLNKNLGGSFSYNRSIFPDSSLFLQSTNANTFSATLYHDWTALTTGLNASYVPGNEGALFLTFNAVKSIDLGFLSPHDYITFDPLLSVVGSTQQILTTEQVPSYSSAGNGKSPVKLPVTKDQTPRYKTVEKTGFGILSYTLNMPVTYNRSRYSVELGYQVSILSGNFETPSRKPHSFLALAFYLLL